MFQNLIIRLCVRSVPSHHSVPHSMYAYLKQSSIVYLLDGWRGCLCACGKHEGGELVEKKLFKKKFPLNIF